ncbi:hypothetical protein CFP71_41805 [Amycolatopsis thailandensis]|uniref:Uncharacterized protein n=1 Tax=Amycolatopsis thailandensis TaxID=589330 RepID=A0A229R935_9PSEU|nr:hypothetical protein CFP71_41805 [Amycolatopsis thailandensis]
MRVARVVVSASARSSALAVGVHSSRPTPAAPAVAKVRLEMSDMAVPLLVAGGCRGRTMPDDVSRGVNSGKG